MLAFVIRRLLLSIVVVGIVSVFAFLIIHMIPGDPVRTMLGLEATDEQVQALRGELGLDKPLIAQYGQWAGNIFRGDLGTSISYNEGVSTLIAQRLPVTLFLSFGALIVGVVVGILAGILSATRRGGWRDQAISLAAITGVGIPIFWLAILCIYLFGLKLHWLPIQGYVSPFENPWQSLRHAVLPVFALSIGLIAVLARQTRSSLLEVIEQDYIRTAWAKGLKERVIVLRHALKNALIPIITLVGMSVRMMVGGAVLVETVFNISGMGRLMVTAVFNKDYVVVQSVILIVAVVTVLTNLLVDVAYGWVDPRIRYS